MLPDPDGDIFRRRIFQSRDVVEAMVIELLYKKAKRFLHVEEIHYESGVRIDCPFQHDLDAIGMTMHPMTAMCLRDVWKSVRCLELKCLGYLHVMPSVCGTAR